MNAAALEFIEASKLPPEMKPLVKVDKIDKTHG